MAVARIYPTSVVSTLGFNQTDTHNSVVVAPTDKSTVWYSMVNPNAGTTYWVGGTLKFPFDNLPYNTNKINSVKVTTWGYATTDSWTLAVLRILNPGVKYLLNNEGGTAGVGMRDNWSLVWPGAVSIHTDTSSYQHQASEWRNNNLNVDVYFKYYTAPGGFNPGGDPVDYWTEIAWSQCYLDIDYTTGPVSSGGSLLFIGENF